MSNFLNHNTNISRNYTPTNLLRTILSNIKVGCHFDCTNM